MLYGIRNGLAEFCKYAQSRENNFLFQYGGIQTFNRNSPAFFMHPDDFRFNSVIFTADYVSLWMVRMEVHLKSYDCKLTLQFIQSWDFIFKSRMNTHYYKLICIAGLMKVASLIDELFPPEDLPNYNVRKIIGKGSYGHVARAVRKDGNATVAIKKLTNIFHKPVETRRILREIILLKSCNHPNIVHLLDIIIPKSQNADNFNDLYLVTEYCDCDLSKVFRTESNFLQLDHVRFIAYQIACGLKYLHSANIIHRDLKPANVLINSKGLVVKICDFGLSRVVEDQKDSENDSDNEAQNGGLKEALRQQTKKQVKHQIIQEAKQEVKQAHTEGQTKRGRGRLIRHPTGVHVIGKTEMTQQEKTKKKQSKLTLRVTTRWYRAPEVILLAPQYNKPIDIWSFGCIFGELIKMMKIVCADALQRFPLFPGKYCYPVSPQTLSIVFKNGYPQGKNDQLVMILSALGKPDMSDLDFLTDQKAKEYVLKADAFSHKSFEDMFKKVDKDAVEIIVKALKFSPTKRPTIDQLLSLKFFESVRKENLETVREPIEMSPEIEGENITLNTLRERIIFEIQEFTGRKL